MLANRLHSFLSNPSNTMHWSEHIFESSKQLFESISCIAFSSFFKSLLSTQNSVPGAFYWVFWIARIRKAPNQVNIVVVEQCRLSFWWNDHEESMQCETVQNRGAKTKSCLALILATLGEWFLVGWLIVFFYGTRCKKWTYYARLRNESVFS